MGENQKNDDSSSLLKVFLDLGVLSEAMLAHLGAMLGHLGAILEQLGDKMWTESAKMSQDSGQDAPTWANAVRKYCKNLHNIAKLEAKMASLAHFWQPLVDFFWILAVILSKIAKIKKTTTVHHF